MVICQIRFLENRCEFKLIRSHFIVACLGRYAKLVTFCFQIKHEGFDTARNSSEVVILELLVFG